MTEKSVGRFGEFTSLVDYTTMVVFYIRSAQNAFGPMSSSAAITLAAVRADEYCPPPSQEAGTSALAA